MDEYFMVDLTQDRANHLIHDYIEQTESFNMDTMCKHLRRLTNDAWKDNRVEAGEEGYTKKEFIEECESEVHSFLDSWNIVVNNQLQPRNTWYPEEISS